MSRRWIADASPLIALAKVDLAHLLVELADEVLVPDEVAAEISAGPARDPARRLLEAGFGRRARPRSIPLEIVEWGLGRGETSVLALALETPHATALLDDAAARRCAAALQVPLLGTIGVVLLAKRSGLVGSAETSSGGSAAPARGWTTRWSGRPSKAWASRCRSHEPAGSAIIRQPQAQPPSTQDPRTGARP